VTPTLIPLDLGPYFTRSYRAGARVHSDSWGGTSSMYSTRCRTLDAFAYANKDFLSVTTAGNQGGSGGTNQPCVAKNTLCVGAASTNSGDASWSLRLEQTGSTFLLTPAIFGLHPLLLDPVVSARVVIAAPADGCSRDSIPSAARGAVLVASRGGTLPSSRLRRIHRAVSTSACVRYRLPVRHQGAGGCRCRR
jgi:hypothetical protein